MTILLIAVVRILGFTIFIDDGYTANIIFLLIHLFDSFFLEE